MHARVFALGLLWIGAASLAAAGDFYTKHKGDERSETKAAKRAAKEGRGATKEEAEEQEEENEP